MFNKATLFEQASGLFGHKGAREAKSTVSNKKIAPIGLTKDEVTVLASMIAIVAIRAQGEWQLGTVDDADIFFVNVESKEGGRFVRRHEGQLPIIKYGKSNKDSGLVKPLRARDLLEAFKGFSLRDRGELSTAGGVVGSSLSDGKLKRSA